MILNNAIMENFFPVTDNTVETLIIGEKVKTVKWTYEIYGTEVEGPLVPDEQNVIRKMIVRSKKTEFENISAKYQSIKH